MPQTQRQVWDEVIAAADRMAPAMRRAVLAELTALGATASQAVIERVLRQVGSGSLSVQTAVQMIMPGGSSQATADVRDAWRRAFEAGAMADTETVRQRASQVAAGSVRQSYDAERASARFSTPDGKEPARAAGTFVFDVSDKRALDYIGKETARLVTEVRIGTREGLRYQVQALLRRGYTEKRTEANVTAGIPYRALARELRGSIGLLPRHIAAVEAFRSRLLDQSGLDKATMRRVASLRGLGDLKAGRTEQIVQKYRNRLLTQRAELIAKTESAFAANAGLLESWRQRVAKGRLDPSRYGKKWITGGDERVCPLCGPMHGKVFPIDRGFAVPSETPVELIQSRGGEIQAPPLHPACRCSMGLATLPGARTNVQILADLRQALSTAGASSTPSKNPRAASAARPKAQRRKLSSPMDAARDAAARLSGGKPWPQVNGSQYTVFGGRRDSDIGNFTVVAGMNASEANQMLGFLVESDTIADAVGIPRIRGVVRTNSRAVIGDMGDGILGWSSKASKKRKGSQPVNGKPFSVSSGEPDTIRSRSAETFWHEFGHHVHQTFGMTTPRVRPLEVELRSESTSQQLDQSATFYGGTSPNEFFAEHFALIRLGRLQEVPQWFLDFLDKRGILDKAKR